MRQQLPAALVLVLAWAPGCRHKPARSWFWSHPRSEASQEAPPSDPARPLPPTPTPMPMPTPMPTHPEAQRIVSVLSALSPENTLAWLPRADQPPVAGDSLVRANIDTWSQPGVYDGYTRTIIYDIGARRFWIEESGGFAGWVHWYGPLVIDARGVIQLASE